MKNIFTAILIFFAVNISFSQQGWFQQSSGTANYLYWVHFISSTTGWTVGQANTVLKTTNSGLNWVAQNPGAPGFLYSVFFISESTGWVVGQSGTIRKTTDGGISWQPQSSGFPSNYLYSVIFTDASFGYITGSSGLILKSIDGGNNWVQVQSGVTNTLSCVCFPISATGSVGYAVGGTATEGVVLKTSSFGGNWTAQTLGTNWLFGVYFTNVVDGWVVGFNGTIYATNNGGSNWTAQTSGTTNRLVAVHFPSANTGYAVGYSGTIIKTTNGGNNWFSQTSPSTNNLWGVYFTDDLTGWAAGWNGTILHTTNGGITYVQKIGYEVPEKFALYQNYPNPFNPVTRIRFDIPPVETTRRVVSTKIVVFDILSKEMAVLVDGHLSPGNYEINWNASGYPSGVYFYRLSAGDYSQTNKMVLIK
jgi:photosystem II stability/assembly factor-like uncharacterized protein